MSKRKRPRPIRKPDPRWAEHPNPSGLKDIDDVIEQVKVKLIYSQMTGAILRDGEIIHVPSELQKEILQTLSKKLLTKEQLTAKNHRPSNVYHRNNDIQELMELGVVAKRRSGGYFRPDDPPPEAIRTRKVSRKK